MSYKLITQYCKIYLHHSLISMYNCNVKQRQILLTTYQNKHFKNLQQ